jgi:hypothetical protein
MSQSSEEETVWVPRTFLASDRVRSYHWATNCPRAREGEDMIRVPLAAVLSSPRLKACPACQPRALTDI